MMTGVEEEEVGDVPGRREVRRYRYGWLIVKLRYGGVEERPPPIDTFLPLRDPWRCYLSNDLIAGK